MNAFAPYTTPGILLLLTLIFGVWLSSSGKPYNGILFTFHKLLALGAVVLAAVSLYPALASLGSRSAVVLLLVLAGLSVVALFASGALLSLERLGYKTMLAVHRISLVLLPTTTVLAIYFINGRMI